MSPTETAQLDPGIRDLVVWLRSKGFDTCDSGDGVTKVERGNEGVIDVPHVIIRVGPEECISEAHRLQDCLAVAGVTPEEGRIEVSYDPANGVAVMALLGLSRVEPVPGATIQVAMEGYSEIDYTLEPDEMEF